MYLSQYLKVDENLSFKKAHLLRVRHQNVPDDIFLLCTASKEGELFEIISGSNLSKAYEQCYLLGISKDKQYLIEQVTRLVDELYNLKIINYESLKAQ